MTAFVVYIKERKYTVIVWLGIHVSHIRIDTQVGIAK